jgi:hypothetical protein
MQFVNIHSYVYIFFLFIFLLLLMFICITIWDFLAQLSVISKIIHKLIGNSNYVLLSHNVLVKKMRGAD